MRISATLSFFLFISFASLGQQKPAYKWPGFVQLNDSVFISQTEISIIDYAEFLHTMKVFFGSYARFEEALPSPNQTDWIGYNPSEKRTFSVGQLYDIRDSATPNHYLYGKETSGLQLDTNVSYSAFISRCPVVNITKAQALLYCEVRTKAFTTLQKNTRKKKDWLLPATVYFRLPTEKEWQQAANDSSRSNQVGKRKQEAISYPIISKTYSDSLKTGESIPVPTFAGHQSGKGMMNICGNVSELVMDSPYGLGGSFLDPVTDCTPVSKSKLQPPQNFIGFRIVAVAIQ